MTTNKMKQKEAVLKAINDVLGEDGIKEGERVTLSKDQRGRIVEKLYEGFKNGEIEIGVEYSDKELKLYTSSLLNNWLRKAKELNGGEAYRAKNPGSRAGQGDAKLRELRKLLTKLQQNGSRGDMLEKVQAAIDSRLEELKAARVKIPDVDWTQIPPELASIKDMLAENASA